MEIVGSLSSVRVEAVVAVDTTNQAVVVEEAAYMGNAVGEAVVVVWKKNCTVAAGNN